MTVMRISAEPSKNFLGFKEHQDWLKVDLNATEIITVQGYKRAMINVNGSTHVQVEVKQVTYESKI